MIALGPVLRSVAWQSDSPSLCKEALHGVRALVLRCPRGSILPPRGDRSPSLACHTGYNHPIRLPPCRGLWSVLEHRVSSGAGRGGVPARAQAGSCWGQSQTPPRLTQQSVQDSQLRPAGPPPLFFPSFPSLHQGRVCWAESASHAILFLCGASFVCSSPSAKSCLSCKYFRPLCDREHPPRIFSGGSAGACEG